MIWATRIFPQNGWYHVQDQFEEQYDAAGEPEGMMLVCVDTPDFKTRIFVGLPDPSLLASYDGFTPSPRANCRDMVTCCSAANPPLRRAREQAAKSGAKGARKRARET